MVENNMYIVHIFKIQILKNLNLIEKNKEFKKLKKIQILY